MLLHAVGLATQIPAPLHIEQPVHRDAEQEPTVPATLQVVAQLPAHAKLLAIQVPELLQLAQPLQLLVPPQ